ncbi:MAG: ribulose-phosphate 3-epimerase [Firmicutes bacterium]|nr:ribulose-phosphate 3-epimerase [Bacillota bacterium]
MVQIAPSILSADFANLAADINQCRDADMLHVDVMDGRFVPNITIGPVVVKDVKKVSPLPLDVHLMIVEPERMIEPFVEAGADLITVHVEACPHLQRTLTLIKQAGVKAGVAVNPATPLSFLPYVLDLTDLVLLMTVNPGFGGQSFIPAMLPKIREARAILDQADHHPILQVDGGINVKTARLVYEAGAQMLVAGSAVFGTGDIPGAIQALRQSVVSA